MSYTDPKDPRRKESLRRWYLKNRAKVIAANRRRRVRIRQWLANYKRKPCADCKRRYPPYVMDFDHRDPTTKRHLVSLLARHGSWKRLQEEIVKCDLVCANCHRIRTHGGC
jgi:hypothetical protein